MLERLGLAWRGAYRVILLFKRFGERFGLFRVSLRTRICGYISLRGELRREGNTVWKDDYTLRLFFYRL